jgi:hypothetical protein
MLKQFLFPSPVRGNALRVSESPESDTIVLSIIAPNIGPQWRDLAEVWLSREDWRALIRAVDHYSFNWGGPSQPDEPTTPPPPGWPCPQ